MKKLLFLSLLALSVNVNTSVSHAEDSRPCSVYPASVTPECVAENLAYEAQRQAAYEAQQKAAQEAAKKAEEANTQKQFEESGSRACSVYPASLTKECIAENLAYEQGKVKEYEAEKLAQQEAAKLAAEEQAKKDFIANGSRPCSVAPASTTQKCIAENLKFEGNRKLTDELSNKLKAINTQSTNNKVALPVSNKIVEKYQAATPKICKVVGNTVVRIKSGNCELKVSFITDQNFKVETTKKITFK
jgi:hypothetical protein